MKKYLDLLVLGGGLLFNALIFAFMAADGVSVNIGLKVSASVYSAIGNFGNDGVIGGLLVALIFVILAVLAGCFLVALIFMKQKFDYAMLVAFGAGLLLLVAGVLFFCTASFAGGGSLGVGAVLSGIFGIIAGLAYVFYGCLKGKLIKL